MKKPLQIKQAGNTPWSVPEAVLLFETLPLLKQRLLVRAALAAIVLLITTLTVQAQRVTPDIVSSVNSGTSDYSVTLSWQGLPSGVDCDNDRKMDFYSGCGTFNNCAFNVSDPHTTISSRGDWGTYEFVEGPGTGQRYAMRYHETSTFCHKWAWTLSHYATTTAIKQPTSVVATEEESYTYIELSWNKGSNIPDFYTVFVNNGYFPVPQIGTLYYRIYRDGGTTPYATVQADGNSMTWRDSNLQANETHTYAITTYTSNEKWGTHESAKVTVTGKTKTFALTASNAEYHNRVKLSWPDLSSIAQDIRIERLNPASNKYEELSIQNKNATFYNDYDGVPGYSYTYKLTPIHSTNTFETYTAQGSKRPNGIIKGEVKSKAGAGVAGVVVTASATFMENTTTISRTYRDTTDASGYYEIRDVYYYREADFKISPSKNNHAFSPDTLSRSISENAPTISGVNFTDTTVYTISGTIYMPGTAANRNCPLRGAEIWVNGRFTGVKTGADGTYMLPIEDEGVYTITPKYKHHAFAAVIGGTKSAQASRQLTIASDLSDIDFEDVQTDTLTIKLAGACNNQISESASFTISTVDNVGCYSLPIIVTANNDTSIVLPAQAYRVELQSTNPVNPNIKEYFRPMVIDLSARDTLTTIRKDSTIARIIPADTTYFANGTTRITPADTTYTVTTDTLKQDVVPRADFIYRSQISLTVHDLPQKVCVRVGNSIEDWYRMEQGDEYRVQIEVNNIFTFNGQTTVCKVDSGMVTIYDDVSDNGMVSLPIKDGFVYYTIKPGRPNIASGGTNGFRKLFQVQAKVGELLPYVAEPMYVMVTGNAPRTKTFVTKTPPLPLYVMHDPPGDLSYSFLEQGTSLTYNYKSAVEFGGSAGITADIYAGGKGFGFEVRAGIKVEFEAGRDNNSGTDFVTTISNEKRFSTSDNPIFTGVAGDVFVSAGINMQYALTDVLGYDSNNCSVLQDTALIWLPQDITTFVYTENHIRNTLVPNLEKLKKLEDNEVKKLELQYSIELWKQMLARNREKIAKMTPKENISFSAGAPYSNSSTIQKDTIETYEYRMFVDASLAPYLKVEASGSGVEAGVFGKFHWSKTITQDTTRTSTTTTGFVFDDSDVGDFFSVDIGEDKASGTPMFRLSAGTSSCPHEPGTQPRDSVAIDTNTGAISDVEPMGQAAFYANLTNLSQSEEGREYMVRVVPTSNPNGAVVKLGGHAISSSPAAFFIAPGETVQTLLTVERGPVEANYEGLQITMYPDCEMAMWRDGGAMAQADTTLINVYFKSQCSAIALYAPGDNWLVNKNSNNKLQVILSGYDRNNAFLEKVFIHYRKISSGGQVHGWQTAAEISKSSLVDSYYAYEFDVSSLEDGEYELRAQTACSEGNGTVLSSIQRGYIDRGSLAPFGMPTPADGFLREGQEISIAFDKAIDCNLSSYVPDITLVRDDTGETIPFTVQCASNLNRLILVPNVPLATRRDLDGILLRATVNGIQDDNANRQVRPVSWSFKVNSKPVFWEPNPLLVSYMQGSLKVIEPVLKSTATTNKVFSIDYYPAWLSPNALSGAILPNNSFVLTSTVESDLAPGVYKDSVVAVVDGFEEVLPVTLEVLAVPVSWKVNPAAYNYSMNIVAQFSLSDANAPLSADTRDVVGAFVNGVARGVAKIQHIPSLNKYAAFITVYSNEPLANKEALTFRFWRALKGEEYGAKETTPFVIDGSLGTAAAPYILHPEGNFQVIPLTQGWNWISFNVVNSDMSREKLFSSLLSSGNRVHVKDQKNFAEFSPGSGWSGTLKTLDNTSGYMVHLSDKPDTLRAVGTPAVISPMSLASGWNWIGYPRSTKMSPDEALAGLSAGQQDLLKSPTAFANFYSNGGGSGYWLGDLREMEPGKSYKLKVSASKSFQYPNGRTATDGSGFEVAEHRYEYNMSVTALLQVNGGALRDDGYTVAAFVNGSCRGFAKPEWVEQLKAYRIFLTIHGDALEVGVPVEFRVYNAHTASELIAESKAVNFVTDLLVGNTEAPHVLSWNEEGFANGYRLGQNKPNPFTGTTTIDYSIPIDEHVRLLVYNKFGVLVKVLVDKEQQAGNYQVTLQPVGLAAGIYLYVLETENYVTSKKMILLNQ
ncbi:hypothetical protein D770_22975 [Flammeovirgaceae bacterium 311]|nr:hypothetical protein D770_22975 [Flammeovirgaceae bacterium 311]